MSELLLTDELIFEAFLWTLYLHSKDRTRQLRMLEPEDFAHVRQLKVTLTKAWYPHRVNTTTKPNYKQWRQDRLEMMQQHYGWSTATRNLYSSIAAVLQAWTYHGRSQATEQKVSELMAGGGRLIYQQCFEQEPTLL